jgi:hypothetical protein
VTTEQPTVGIKAMGTVLALSVVALLIATFFWFDQHESNAPQRSYFSAKRAFQRGDHTEATSYSRNSLMNPNYY